MIRYFLLLSAVLLLRIPLQAQMIDSRIDVYFGIHRGFLIGHEPLINDRGFVMPSAFGNLNSLQGIQLKAAYNLLPLVSLGVGTDFQTWGDWQHPTQKDYYGMGISNVFTAPHLKLHTPHAMQGIFNRLNLYVELAPGIGFSRTTIIEPLFLVFEDNRRIGSPYETTEYYFGVKSSIGAGFILNRFSGLFANFSVDHYRMNSLLYLDRKMNLSRIEAGVFIRLWHDKSKYFVDTK